MNTSLRALTLGGLLLASCQEDLKPPAKPRRPVTYVTVQEINPSATARLAGTVESWKRENIGFEVGGRILRVVDPGTDILGETFDEAGTQLTDGTVIATLDDSRYRIALQEQVALLNSARANVKVAETELSDVIPEQLKGARADLEFQQQEFERYTSLVAENAASKERLEQVQTANTVAQARVAEIEGLRTTKTAALEGLKAQVALLEEAVARAQLDLDDCALVSPFTGQIARVHEIPGGFVLPGQPVLTVQMMDPMKVLVAVAASLDARIQYNDRVRVHLEGYDEPFEGFVYLKDTYADPATRTYLVTLLVRNRKVVAVGDEHLEDPSIAQATGLWPLEQEDPDGDGPYFVEVSSLLQDDQGWYVLKADDLGMADLMHDFDRRLTARKVRVTPGERKINIIQLFTFQELADIGELDPERDVVLRGLTRDVADGDPVLVLNKRWLMRPGDVVHVELKGPPVPAGFYVPEEAIQYDGQMHYVFALQGGDTSSPSANRVDVTVGATAGKLQRIESMEADALAAGARLILDGAHYVVDQELVNPIEEVSVER